MAPLEINVTAADTQLGKNLTLTLVAPSDEQY